MTEWLTNERDAIAWAHKVDERVVSERGHGVWRLALGNEVWRLLHLDQLLVGEEALVVKNLRGVPGPTTVALCRFPHLATLISDPLRRPTFLTHESCHPAQRILLQNHSTRMSFTGDFVLKIRWSVFGRLLPKNKKIYTKNYFLWCLNRCIGKVVS